MNQLKEIFALSLFILLSSFILLAEEDNSILEDPNALLINTPQDNFHYSPFILENKNKLFSTFSSSSNKKNDKEFCIENLNIDRKKELNTRTKENYSFRDLNLSNDYLNYSHKVKMTDSSHQLYSIKDEKNSFKPERGISRVTYELLRLISSIRISKY